MRKLTRKGTDPAQEPADVTDGLEPKEPEDLPLETVRATTGPKMVPLPHEYLAIQPGLAENEAYLREAFTNSTDIVFREFYMDQIRCMAIWVDGLINNRVSHDLFRALMIDVHAQQIAGIPAEDRIEYTNLHLLPFYATIKIQDLAEAKRWIMMAKMMLFIDGSPFGLVLDAEATPMRSISEPIVESSVYGPKDAFVESLRINTALIRSRLGDPELKSENYILGRRSNTLVTLMFIDGLARPEILQEVRRRLSRIDIDAVIDSAYLKELIVDRKYYVFPIMKATERPDKVVADLLEGRFVLIVDGSPIVLTAPTLLMEFFQAAEDYYNNPVTTTFIRLLRYGGFILSTTLLGFFVAITTFHQEMIPIPLVFGIAGTRESVPFPAVVEAITMLIPLELLWEAGIRLPRIVGGAVSIVGALILGQAAVQAGFVSPAMVIVVALTAIANFVLGSGYELANAIRLIRITTLLGGAAFGLYGLTLVLLAWLAHLGSLTSFKVPYMALVPIVEPKGMWDMIFRAPRWDMNRRPEVLVETERLRDNTPPPEPLSGTLQDYENPQNREGQ
ncbi:MAG: spore germination protein [Solirubrobacterales bacterium]